MLVQIILSALFCANCLLFNSAHAEETCSINGIQSTRILQIEIKDTQADTSIFQNSANGITNDSFTTGVTVTEKVIDEQLATSYFNFRLSEDLKQFDLSTTAAFKNVNKDVYTNGKNLIITISLEFKCASDSLSVTFIIVVKDTMSNKPRFLGDSYTYTVPMPIMPKTDFSFYGAAIEAEDINFSNTRLDFELTPADFVATSVQVSNKVFKAQFQATRLLTLTTDTTYKLTVIDSGSNQISTDIILKVDKSSGLDIPYFSTSFYTFDYDATNSDPLKSTSGVIQIHTEKPKEISLDLDGSAKEYFTPSLLKNSVVSIALTPNTILPKFQMITLTLKCTTDVTTSSTLIITNVQDKSKETLYFEENYYTYIYVIKNEEPKLTLSGTKIKLVNVNSVETTLSLKGDYASYFNTPVFDSDGSTVTLTLNKEKVLPSDAVSLVKLQLVCKADDVSATTDIVISVETSNDKELYFKETYYTYTYVIKNGEPSLTLSGTTIKLINVNSVETTLSLKGDYASYFPTPVFDSDGSTVTLTLNKEKVLPSDAVSLVKLQLVCKADDVSATTDIVISVKTSNEKELYFQESYYTYTYVIKNGEPSLTLSGTAIKLVNVNSVETTLSLKGDYASYFTTPVFDSDGSTVTLTLNKEKVLPSDAVSLVKLQLVCKADEISAATDIVISVETSNEKDLYFQESYYTYTYVIKNGEPSLTLSGTAIKLVNVNSVESTLSLKGEYDSYFANPVLESDGFTVTLSPQKEVLPSDAGNLVKLTLHCQSGKLSTSADIVISIVTNNEQDQDVFTKNYYSFNYTDDGTKANLVSNNGDITISTTKSYTISDLTLKGDFNDYFIVSIETQNLLSTEKAMVIVKLSAKILPEAAKNTIILTLSLPNAIETNIIILNDRNTSETPKFNKPHYSAVYDPVTNSVFLDYDIDGTEIEDLTLLQDSPIASYFAIEKENAKYEIKLTKSLPTELLSNTSCVILTLVAKSNTESSYSTLVVNFPPSSVAPAPSTVNTTGYLIGVIVLSILLLSTIAAALVLWYFKMRSTKYSEDENDIAPNKKPVFLKNQSVPKTNAKVDNVVRRPTGFVPTQDAHYTLKDSVDYDYPTPTEINLDIDKLPKKNISEDDGHDSGNDSMVPSRRATGFVFNPYPRDSDEISVENPLYQSDSELSPKAERKSVAFDNVQDKNHTGGSEKIANRRPTTFSFAHPSEGNQSDDESSDGVPTTDKERKKSVAFNDKIERMHVENNNRDSGSLNEYQPNTIDQLII